MFGRPLEHIAGDYAALKQIEIDAKLWMGVAFKLADFPAAVMGNMTVAAFAQPITHSNARELARLTLERQQRFVDVLHLLGDHRMSHRAVDRDGRTVADIVSQNKSSAWLDLVWQLHKDNTYVSPFLIDQLVQRLRVTNETCLIEPPRDAKTELTSLPCELSALLGSEETALVMSELASIAGHEHAYSFNVHLTRPASREARTAETRVDGTVQIVPSSDGDNQVALYVEGGVLFAAFQQFPPVALRKSAVRQDDIEEWSVQSDGMSPLLYETLFNAISNSVDDITRLSLPATLESELFLHLRASGFTSLQKQIRSWADEDFAVWRFQHKHNFKTLGESLAVVKEAVRRTHHQHFTPREIQVVAVLMMLKGVDRGGIVAKINPGGGKSAVIAILSSLFVSV